MEKPSKVVLHRFFKRSYLPQRFEEICEFVTKFMIEEYEPEDAYHINCGWCFVWAYLVWCLSPYKHKFKNLRQGGGHVVVMHSNKHYDSEHPKGESNTTDNFRYYGKGRPIYDVENMCAFWLVNGYANDLLIDIIRKTQTQEDYTRVIKMKQLYW